ncbi:MAG: VWA domain-containing protein [Spirochaetales bacterium]|nr:VWA domain-containing protein [Spirochaetales bacterium]
MKKLTNLTLVIIFFIVLGGISFADERPPIDIMMAVDVSNSMAQEIEAVKDYINNELLENYVQIGDYLLIIMFYATTEVPVAISIQSEADLQTAKQAVAGLQANHDWTDIGNALDVLKLHMDAQSTDQRDKFLIIITDGEQTAPWSKYTTPDGSLNHELLQNAYTEIAKEGWKVQFLVSGGSDMIKEMAEKISGTYTEISEEPTGEELSEKIQEPGGMVKISVQPEKVVVTHGGEAVLPLTLSCSGFTKEQSINVNNIMFYSNKAGELNILKSGYELSIQPDETKQVEIPLQFPAALAAGDYKGELLFSFGSQALFTPGRIETQVHINNLFENYPWIIPVAILVVIALIILIILLILMRSKARTLNFKLLVEEEPLKEGKDTFSIKIGQVLYLNESLDMFSIAAKKSLRSLAKLTGQQGAIKFELLREENMPNVKKMKGNILGEKLEVLTSSGKKMHITMRK